MLIRLAVLGSRDAEDKNATWKVLNAVRARLDAAGFKLWLVVTTSACGVAFHASEWANKRGINRISMPPSYGEDPTAYHGRADQERDEILAGVVHLDMVLVFPGAEAQAARVCKSAPYDPVQVFADDLDGTWALPETSEGMALETPEDDEEDLL